MKIAIAANLLILLAGLSGVGHGSEGKEVTLKGEVVDLQCSMVHPKNSRGPDHAECAQFCMSRGLPIGFLAENGKVYLLLGPGHDSVAERVADEAGKIISLKGKVVKQSGMLTLQLPEEGSGHH